MYRLFEHTADLGIHVESATLEGLYADAGCGLFAIIAESLASIGESESREFVVAGQDREFLLVDWLSELLAAFELQRLLLRRFEVRLSGDGLLATGFGELLDLTRHRLGHEVKAITYHELRVAPMAGGWAADVIVDI